MNLAFLFDAKDKIVKVLLCPIFHRKHRQYYGPHMVVCAKCWPGVIEFFDNIHDEY
jgi:hypothetical protein